MTFGAKVLKLRQSKGFTQKSLAVAIGGITNSAISDWENPEMSVVPKMDVALRAARILGVPLDYLADDSLDDLPKPVDDQGALNLDQQMLLRAIQTIGFDEAWRRLMLPAPDRTAEFQAEIERAYPRDDRLRS